jgi:hypothetical protein
MIESGAQFWILDEFVAALDRGTTKIMATIFRGWQGNRAKRFWRQRPTQTFLKA